MKELTRSDEKLIFKEVDGRTSRAEKEKLVKRVREDANVRKRFEETQQLVDEMQHLADVDPQVDLAGRAERQAALAPTEHNKFWLRWLAGAGALTAAVALAWFVVVPRLGGVDKLGGFGRQDVLTADVVVGTVWLNDRGSRRQAQTGVEVPNGATLETGGDSSIILARSGGHLTLHEATAARVSASRDTTAVVIEHGVVRADADALLSFEIRAAGLPQVVQVRNASAGVITNGRSGFAVSCTRGTAVVSTSRDQVIVERGRTWVGTQGGAVSESALTTELTLDLEPLAPFANGVHELEIVGHTRAGAVLSIDGDFVDVGADGSFKHRVAYRGGLKKLTLRVRDALNRKYESVVALVPAPARAKGLAPIRPVQTHWEWEALKTPG